MGDFIQRQLFAVADAVGVTVGLAEEIDMDMKIPEMNTPQYQSQEVHYGYPRRKGE